jgi:hypothetical protein
MMKSKIYFRQDLLRLQIQIEFTNTRVRVRKFKVCANKGSDNRCLCKFAHISKYSKWSRVAGVRFKNPVRTRTDGTEPVVQVQVLEIERITRTSNRTDWNSFLIRKKFQFEPWTGPEPGVLVRAYHWTEPRFRFRVRRISAKNRTEPNLATL